MLQSPDLAKVKEELSRLQKRLKAGTKLVEEKQKLHKDQSQLSAKLQADLENVTDGKGLCSYRSQMSSNGSIILEVPFIALLVEVRSSLAATSQPYKSVAMLSSMHSLTLCVDGMRG